ncbi:MAG: Unknown protein [uncultured Campylobacterales bacterium]|uniref:CopG family transcriptional regulator n=1 Tax=uncultured Campylobacterales bacterium TaxID=352960 RepID=A0A6S6T3B1_9BACT|nr:MAG: Unknown protein [uncultured Campylobacterales bacterium]
MKKIDDIFDENDGNILDFFDADNIKKVNQKNKRVNIDFPQWMVNMFDSEASRIGVTRQSIIKMWLAQKLETFK